MKSKLICLKDKNLKKFIGYNLEIKDMINELNNKNNSDCFKKQINLKLDLILNKIDDTINLGIYYDIINTLIIEKKEWPKEKYNNNVIQNLFDFNNYLKKLKIEENNKKNKRIEKIKNKKYYINKIILIIPFYSDNAKGNVDHDIYIAINSKGDIIICSFKYQKKK